MLTPTHRAQLFAADEATRVAIAVAQTNAENTGWLGDEGTHLAAVETARRAYLKARARLVELVERVTYATDAEVTALRNWFAVIGDFRALNEGLAASSLGGALVATAKETAHTVITPTEWPSWLKKLSGTLVVAGVAAALAPVIVGAIVGAFARRRR